MENSKYYGGRDFAGNFLQEDFTVEPETINLNLTTDENPDRKQVTP